MKRHLLWWYSALFIGSFLLDRITKQIALTWFVRGYEVNQFLSLDLAFNRGISWALFHSVDSRIFITVSSVIALIIACLIAYTYIRWREGEFILGELLMVSGAVSNFVDRIVYKGVVDFIAISAGDWSWPIFNMADLFIVVGVSLMLLESLRQK